MTPTLAEAWLHDLSPFVVRFTESFGIRWYGLAYALGFVAGYLQLRWLSRRGVIPLPAARVGDAVLTVVVGVVVGGRLGYVLFYEQHLLWTFFGDPPWWGVLAINRGGMSSHGGILGVILAAWWVGRGWKRPDGTVEGRSGFLRAIDAFAFVAPIGLFFGRLANFVNGELLGRVVARPGEPSPWWSVKYPQEVLTEHESYRTPAQEQALDALVMRQAPEFDVPWGAVYEGIVARIQRGGPEGERLAAELAPLLSARYPSQLVQALAEGVLLSAVLWVVWAKRRRPGVLGCWFLIAYGVMRVLTEFVRLPDTQVQMPRIMWLTRGQWLSLLMVGVGVVVLTRLRRRGVECVGGWFGSRPDSGSSGGAA